MPRFSPNGPNDSEQTRGQRLQGGDRDWGWTDVPLNTAQAQGINSSVALHIL